MAEERRGFLADPATEQATLIALLAWSTLVQTLVILFMPLSISNDSWGYIDFARNLFGGAVPQRTAGFPFLLAVTGVPRAGTMVFFAYVQSLMAISLPLLVYFTIRPFSKSVAFGAGLLGTCILYPYVMALEALTDISYMWCTALVAFFLSRYLFSERLTYLVLAVVAAIAIALIRVSGTLQFLCLMAAVVLALLYRWRETDKRRVLLRHGAIAVALFAAWSVGYGLISDRTSSKIVPFFVFNWIYKSGHEIYYGIVSPDNGPRTQKFFAGLAESLKDNPGFFRAVAESGKDRVKAIAQSKWVYDESDVQALIDDIVANTVDDQRGFIIPFGLAGTIGVGRASELLLGAIQEAFLAHPMVLVKRAKTVLLAIPQTLNYTPGPVFYTTGVWLQVPKPGTASGTLSAGVFAEWIYGLDLLAGSDREGRDEGKDRYGHFPETFSDAAQALAVHRNLTAFGNYVTYVSSRTIIPCIWVVMVAGAFFAFWSRNPPAAIGLVLLGSIPPFVFVVISETDMHHFVMAVPVQLMAAAASVDGAIRLVNRLTQRRKG